MGMAVLEVNYRGSAGMGDESLQAIVGNVGEVSLETHEWEEEKCTSNIREDP